MKKEFILKRDWNNHLNYNLLFTLFHIIHSTHWELVCNRSINRTCRYVLEFEKAKFVSQQHLMEEEFRFLDGRNFSAVVMSEE